MNSILKIVALLLAFIFVNSCGVGELFEEFCPDDSKNLGSDIKFGKYIADFGQAHSAGGYAIRGTQELILYEDSSFSYLRRTIPKNETTEDTIMKFDGKFKIYPDSGFAWHVFKLEADSIYEKKMKRYTVEDPSYFEADFTSKEFAGFSDSLISDVDVKSNCFSLAYKTNPATWESDLPQLQSPYGDEYCDKIILGELYTYCFQQPEDTLKQQNSTGDKQ